VPNSKIVNQNFLNWTFRERRSRVAIPIGVASDSDVDLVTRTLLRAADGVQFVLEEPKPSVQFMDFGDFNLKFRLLVWTEKPRRHVAIRSDINYRIARLFREAGIEIPNPQRDINLRSGALRLDPRAGLIATADGEEEETGARR